MARYPGYSYATTEKHIHEADTSSSEYLGDDTNITMSYECQYCGLRGYFKPSLSVIDANLQWEDE